MIEDDIYETSSQFRYWSYTRETLSGLRKTTNQLAAERVKDAFRRSRAGQPANDSSKASTDIDIDTLTVDEELRIIRWGCSKIIEMGEAMTPKIPMNVVVCEARSVYLENVC